MQLKLNILFASIMSILFANISTSQNIADLLPAAPAGWEIAMEDKMYDPKSLYDYIDGGAELYISYSIKEVISRFITNENGDEIRIEIFDMSESKNAFGVFTHTRTQDEGIYGQGSQYFPGTQIFWKDKYYVSIMATDENEAIRSAIKDLASEINDKINTTGKMPDVVSLLPLENLKEDGCIYFHHYIWLNSYYFIANDNLFGIDDHTNAILAKYGSKDNRHYLLVIEYENEEKPGSAFSVFKTQFLNPQSDETAVQIEDGSWLGGTTYGKYLICIFNAPSKTEIDNLIDKITENIQR